jgi:predicted secreted hydrolase
MRMAAHDIPDTADMRRSLARAQAEGLEALGLQLRTVEPWEDGYRAATSADSTFEWWYFDAQLDDGSTLVVTFANKPHNDPAGPVHPTLLVIRQHADGTSRHLETAFDAADFTAARDRCDVRLGASTVRGDLRDYVLHVEAEDVVIDLTLHRETPSWRPGAGITYFDAVKDRYLAWVVPVPYGTVTATITEGGRTTELTGGGYHDHNWGNHLMGSFLDHWYWGRAHVGDYTVVYVRMTTRGVFGFGEFHLPTFFLAKGDRLITDDLLPLRLETSDEVPGPDHQAYPTRMVWSWETRRGSITMTVTNPTLMDALDVAVPHHGKAPLLHGAERPEYYEFTADIDLDIRLEDLTDRVAGRTVYEKMMFR